MVKAGLRAIFLALLAFVITSPARADAQVENAVRLFEGDLTSTYAQTLSLIVDKKINDAKPLADRLQDLTYQLSTAIVNIRQAATALAPELGAAWADTETAANELHKATSDIKAVLGRTLPSIDNAKKAFETLRDALKKSVEFTKNFAETYSDIKTGPMDSAKELFAGYLTDGYKKTIEYLDAYNTDDGKTEIDRLREIVAKLHEFTGTASSSAAGLARPLGEAWRPVHDETGIFQEEVEDVQDVVGNGDYDLGDMKEAFSELNAQMSTSYNLITQFGAQLRLITDNWS